MDRTHVYLEHSKSSPINLSLIRDRSLSPSDPFLETIPHTIGRLRSLIIEGTLENLQDITSHLSHPAPLLERLLIHGGHEHRQHRKPMVTPALFNGDLSSLCQLCLDYVRTKLPWRNMVNLTLFTLAHTFPGEVTIRRLLDFLESAPQLHKVDLHFATPISGVQNGRLVSLPCLKWMGITGDRPSNFLGCLLIPVGVELVIHAGVLGSLIGDHLPESLNNLKNFSNFNTIKLDDGRAYPIIQFSGLNGQVKMILRVYGGDTTCLMLESLAGLETLKTK